MSGADPFAQQQPCQDRSEEWRREGEGLGIGHRGEEIAPREGRVDPENTERQNEGAEEPPPVNPEIRRSRQQPRADHQADAADQVAPGEDVRESEPV